MFPGNPSPLRSLRITLKYLLLPPRSALEVTPRPFTWTLLHDIHVCLLHHHWTTLCYHNNALIDDEWGIGERLSAIHFKGYCIRLVSSYTLLSWFQLPWPQSSCLDAITPFMVSMSQYFGTLTSCSVHPASPVLLTRTSPQSVNITRHAPLSSDTYLAHSEFENRLRIRHPKCSNGFPFGPPCRPSNHSLYRTKLSHTLAILREISAETS